MDRQLHDPPHRTRYVVVLEQRWAPGDARDALTENRPRHGAVAVQTSTFHGTQADALDVLDALDKRARNAVAQVFEPDKDAAWNSVVAWCAAMRVRRITFLDADRFSPERWRRTVELYKKTDMSVLIFYAGEELPEAAHRALADVEHTIVADPDEALGLLGPERTEPDPVHLLDELMYSAPPVPTDFPGVPRAPFHRFRADAYRALDPESFAALDTQYRYGTRAACTWISRHAEYEDACAPRDPLAPELLPRYLTPRETELATQFLQTSYGFERARTVFEGLMCVGRDPSPRRRYPFAWRDPAGLQTFLCALVAEVCDPAASVARIRGTQAGFLLHGLLLSVPEHLRDQRGPGLAGTALTPEVCALLAAELAHPVHAAAAALALLTGLDGNALHSIRINAVDTHAMTVEADARYIVPPAARYLITAARAFSRLESGAAEHPRLLNCKSWHDGCDEIIATALDACGLRRPTPPEKPRPASPWAFDTSDSPWHAKARCWYVAKPLHGPRADERDDDHGRVP